MLGGIAKLREFAEGVFTKGEGKYLVSLRIGVIKRTAVALKFETEAHYAACVFLGGVGFSGKLRLEGRIGVALKDEKLTRFDQLGKRRVRLGILGQGRVCEKIDDLLV